MAVETLQQLFEHECKDMFAAEQKVLEALPDMISEAQDRDVKTALQEHKKQTQEQIKRIKQVYKLCGIKLGGETCPGMDGLIREKKAFNKEKPSPELLEFYNLGAGEKVERYEITSYEGLIDLAEKLQLSEVVDLFGQSLQEEQQMYDRLHSFSQNFDASQFIASEQEEEMFGGGRDEAA